jgi:hypothetical protein
VRGKLQSGAKDLAGYNGWACFMLLGGSNRNKMRATLTIPSFGAADQPH